MDHRKRLRTVLEQIWSAASEPTKWGHGLLQTSDAVGDG
jgi:hypothetical protein